MREIGFIERFQLLEGSSKCLPCRSKNTGFVLPKEILPFLSTNFEKRTPILALCKEQSSRNKG